MASINLNSTLVKTVMLKVIGDGGDANRMLDEIAAKAEALKELNPELTVSIDRAKAMADATVMKAEMRRILSQDPIEIPVEPDVNATRGLFSRFLANILPTLIGAGGPIGGAGGIAGFGGFGAAASSVGDIAASFGVVGIVGLVAAIMGIINAAGALIAGLLAAAQGLTAFAALAYPTISGILAGYTTISADIAAQQSAHGVAGQMTLGQAQAAAAAKTKADLAALDPIQRRAVQNLIDLYNQFQKDAAQFESKLGPLLNIVLGKKGILSQILADLMPFANAAVGPLTQLAKSFNQWLNSPGAEQFQKLMIKMTPGVLLALGNGIGHVAVNIGKLLEVFSHGNDAKDVITGIFNIIGGLISLLTILISAWNTAWDWVVREVGKARKGVLGEVVNIGLGIGRFVTTAVNDLTGIVVWWQNLPSKIKSAMADLPGVLFAIGKSSVQGLINGIESIPVIGPVVGVGVKIVNAITGHMKTSSPSRVMFEIGQNITRGLILGMQAPGIPGISASLSGYGGGGGLMLAPGAGTVLEQAIVQIIRNYVIARGGGGKDSVQVAFGQRS